MSRIVAVNSAARYSPIGGVEMRLGEALGGVEAPRRLEIEKAVLELGFLGDAPLLFGGEIAHQRQKRISLRKERAKQKERRPPKGPPYRSRHSDYLRSCDLICNKYSIHSRV